jgi:hypothetical protein
MIRTSLLMIGSMAFAIAAALVISVSVAGMRETWDALCLALK